MSLRAAIALRAVAGWLSRSADLSSACQARSVVLQLKRGQGNGGEFRLHDVTTPAATVNNPPASAAAFDSVFQDLRTGVSLGAFEVTDDGSPDDVLSFDLNSAGIAGFNAARGGFFTLGGDGAGWNEETQMFTNMFSGPTDAAKLIAVCASS